MASPKPISLTQVPVDDYDGAEAPQPFVVVGPVPGGGGGGSTTWTTIPGKPAVVASGATQAAARESISAPSQAEVDQNMDDVTEAFSVFANNTTALLAGKADLVSGKVPASQLPDAPTKTSLGLGNVDNTSDASKPVSTAQASAINAKVSGLNGATGLWIGTQVQYDAVTPKLDTVSYVIRAA